MLASVSALAGDRVIEAVRCRAGAAPNAHQAFCAPSLRLAKLSEKHRLTSSQFEYVNTKWYTRCANGWPWIACVPMPPMRAAWACQAHWWASWFNSWANCWVWYVGPACGAVIAAVVYELLYLRPLGPARVGPPETGLDEPGAGISG